MSFFSAHLYFLLILLGVIVHVVLTHLHNRVWMLKRKEVEEFSEKVKEGGVGSLDKFQYLHKQGGIRILPNNYVIQAFTNEVLVVLCENRKEVFLQVVKDHIYGVGRKLHSYKDMEKKEMGKQSSLHNIDVNNVFYPPENNNLHYQDKTKREETRKNQKKQLQQIGTHTVGP